MQVHFLDFGGRATTESIYQALKVISKVDKIKVILVNLFGGIVRTDSSCTSNF